MNEYKITCDVCRDLLPLVKDGVASADSEEAVRQHIGGCAECEMLFDGKLVPAIEPSESPKALLKVKRWLSWLYTALMLLGIYFGLSLTAGDDLFFNCLIMPVAGVLGYLVFKWKALFAVPFIMFVTYLLTNVIGAFGGTMVELGELLSWTFIYSIFTWAGTVIAMLLHFAFGKKSFGKEKLK